MSTSQLPSFSLSCCGGCGSTWSSCCRPAALEWSWQRFCRTSSPASTSLASPEMLLCASSNLPSCQQPLCASSRSAAPAVTAHEHCAHCLLLHVVYAVFVRIQQVCCSSCCCSWALCSLLAAAGCPCSLCAIPAGLLLKLLLLMSTVLTASGPPCMLALVS